MHTDASFRDVGHAIAQQVQEMDRDLAQTVCAAALLAWGALWGLKRCVMARRSALRAHLGDPQALLRRRRGGSVDDERYALLLPVSALDGAR